MKTFRENWIARVHPYYLQWQIQDFPQGGAPTPKSAIIFQFCSRKLHEKERIWTPKGARVPGAPLRSANESLGCLLVQKKATCFFQVLQSGVCLPELSWKATIQLQIITLPSTKRFPSQGKLLCKSHAVWIFAWIKKKRRICTALFILIISLMV